MEQKHRDIIDIHCDEIISRIDMLKLFPKLLEHRIYNPDDVNISHWVVSFIHALFIYRSINDE